jgi:Uma2 family endonuclease
MLKIILPETKPALEWVNGRALQKVSPQRKHSIAQTRFAAALDSWTRQTRAGITGTEWRFQIQPPGEASRPLVPDVAFLSYARLSYDRQITTDVPSIAPDVAVEILSPDDRIVDIDEKVRVYLAAGTSVVFLVDTERRVVTIRDSSGKSELDENAVLNHGALTGFRLLVEDLFSVPKPE